MDYSLVQKYDGKQDSILRIEKRFTLHKVEIENQKDQDDGENIHERRDVQGHRPELGPFSLTKHARPPTSPHSRERPWERVTHAT